MIVEANEELAEYVPDYPLGYALMAFGVFLTLSVEQIALSIAESYKANDKCASSPNACEVEMGAKPEQVIASSSPGGEDVGKGLTVAATPAVERQEHNQEHSHDHEGMALDDLLAARTIKDLAVAYTLELSIMTHSIIIGVNLGLYGPGEYDSLVAYLVALVFHQLIEGIGMGEVLLSNRKNFGQAKFITFLLIFCSSISLGVIIGIATSSRTENDSQIVVKAVASAIAGGALLYSSLAELIVRCFHNPSLYGKVGMKLGMLASFAFGLGTLALIAYWA